MKMKENELMHIKLIDLLFMKDHMERFIHASFWQHNEWDLFFPTLVFGFLQEIRFVFFIDIDNYHFIFQIS